MKKIGGFLAGLLFFLLWNVSSWLCSLPALATLVLHFVIGLPLYWFWLTLGLWLLAGLVRYLLVRFARWGAQSPASVHENKNPYSGKTGPANR